MIKFLLISSWLLLATALAGPMLKGADEDRSDCVMPHSLPNNCTPCREKIQCEIGGFCCPFNKLCQTKRGQVCPLPTASAHCLPVCLTSDCTSCSPTDGTSYEDWGKPTCVGF